MIEVLRRTVFAAVFVAAIGAASAENMSAKLTGAEKTARATTQATGEGKIPIGKDMSVKGSVKTKGIMGTAAHIHLAPTGQAGPPIITLSKSGEDTWNVPDGAKLTEEQYRAFKDGNLY